MAKNLLIIESPNKIETISHFLSKDWKILATIGHIRDLSHKNTDGFKNGYNEKTLEPDWVISNKLKVSKNPRAKPNPDAKTQQQIVDEIRKEAKEAKHIYLATDPDREGEAIAWHVYEVLDKKEREKCLRVTFNEITEEAVLEALSEPRQINIPWVHSQFARRILDRMVGFGLSDITRKKLGAQSAGRVQTVALRFLHDREELIKKFTTDVWYICEPKLKGLMYPLILRELSKENSKLDTYFLDKDKNEIKKFDKTTVDEVGFRTEDAAKKFKNSLSKKFEIYAIDEPRKTTSKPPVPFKTSTMQQSAINSLGMTIGQVTSAAQMLYEGIRLNGKHVALISYPRTDSLRFSDSFIQKAKKYIVQEYGEKNYVFRSFAGQTKASSEKNVQDAHEGIRVIDPFLTPAMIKDKIDHNQYKLYKLIWMRSLACFLPDSISESTVARFINNGNKFYSHSSKVIFAGYKTLWNLEAEGHKEPVDLSKYKVGDEIAVEEVTIKQSQKTPPPRYNQASLIKELDEKGVGRPSTYKTMAQVAIDRGYANLESRAYHMTPLGDNVVTGLEHFFPEIVDVQFTKEMEEHLDEIANKDEGWREWVLSFEPKFKKQLKDAEEHFKRPEPEVALDEHGKPMKCPKCGKPLVKRYSPKSKTWFIGCSGFPECHYAVFPEQKNHHPQEIIDEKCPICGSPLAKRWNKRGQVFIGCTKYPQCRYARPADMTAEEYEKYKVEHINDKKKGSTKKPKGKKKTKK